MAGLLVSRPRDGFTDAGSFHNAARDVCRQSGRLPTATLTEAVGDTPKPGPEPKRPAKARKIAVGAVRVVNSALPAGSRLNR